MKKPAFVVAEMPTPLIINLVMVSCKSFTHFFRLLLIAGITAHCSQQPVLFEETFTVRAQVKRALAVVNDNFNIYTSAENVNWIGKKIYARLVAADKYDAADNTLAPVVKAVGQTNGFGLSGLGSLVRDPFNPGGGQTSIFELPPLSETVALLGTGTASQTISLIDFQGVKPGRYDLVVFADIETRLSVEGDLPKTCSCTRATGCSQADLDEFAIKKNAGDCLVLAETAPIPKPSNGDYFFVIDNISVEKSFEKTLKELALRHDADAGLYVQGKGAGDGDVWDEWRCIYHASNLPGIGLHNYTFPDNTGFGSDAYCLPETTSCGQPGETAGKKKECGTLMDFGLHYNGL